MSKRKRKKAEAAEAGRVAPRLRAERAAARRRHGSAAWRPALARTRFEMKQVFKSPAFVVLIALGLFNTVASLWFSGEMFGTPTLPGDPRADPDRSTGSFTIIPIIIAIYYAGELVWRERDRQDARDHRRDAAAQLGLCRPQDAGGRPGPVHHPADQRRRRDRWSSCSRAIPTSSSANICSGTCCRSGVGTGAARGAGGVRPGAQPEQICRLGGDGALHRRHDRPRPRSGFEHNLYHYGETPAVPLSDMNGAGRLLDGRLVVPALLGRLRGHPAGRSRTCCGGAAPRPG